MQQVHVVDACRRNGAHAASSVDGNSTVERRARKQERQNTEVTQHRVTDAPSRRPAHVGRFVDHVRLKRRCSRWRSRKECLQILRGHAQRPLACTAFPCACVHECLRHGPRHAGRNHLAGGTGRFTQKSQDKRRTRVHLDARLPRQTSFQRRSAPLRVFSDVESYNGVSRRFFSSLPRADGEQSLAGSVQVEHHQMQLLSCGPPRAFSSSTSRATS